MGEGVVLVRFFVVVGEYYELIKSYYFLIFRESQTNSSKHDLNRY